MAFKIKDGVRIGTVDVFNNAGGLLVGAPSAATLTTARTIAISGAVTGTATSFDGSANITISATALAAGNLSGTIPSGVLGSSSVFIGTTSVALNRATASLSLTGVSIDGNAGTVTNGVYTNGSYADPSWITSLAKSKVGLANVENTALSTWAGSTNITSIGAATATSLTVTGNLIVNGTTNTINSTVTTLDDPVITLGGDTAPASDDNKDRGVEFRWHNGTVAKLGFFGYDDSTGKFTFVPDATNTSEVFSGTKGTLDANVEWADILNKPTIGTGSVTSVALTVPTGLSISGSPITTNGTLAVTLTAGYSIPTTSSQTNWDTAFTDRLKWDGNSTALTPSTGRTSLGATTVGSNLFTLTNPTAVTFLRVNADNTVSTLDAATFRTAIGAGTSSTTGTVTSIATNNGITGGTITGTGTIGLTGQALALHNLASSGIIVRTAADTVAARSIVAGTNVTVTNGDGVAGNITINASFTEADTLATVTGRGATTGTALTLTNATNTTSSSTGALVVTGGVAVNADLFVKGNLLNSDSAGAIISAHNTVSATVATVSATAVDSWAVATYRSARYIVQITQGSNYQVSEILVLHNGTTTYMTEYAVLESSGSALGTFTSDISGGNARLLVTMASATSATFKVIKDLILV